MNFQLPKIRKHCRRRFNQTPFCSELHVHIAVSMAFWKESFEENMYLEEGTCSSISLVTPIFRVVGYERRNTVAVEKNYGVV